MPNVQRAGVEFGGDQPLARAFDGHGYAAGGDIAKLQADLARRLANEGVEGAAETSTYPAERAVRFISVAGGYLLLLAGYVAIASIAYRYA